jgi:hypothetical protein
MSYCPYPPPPPPRRTNSMAIAAIITAVFVAPVGIVLGFVARSQIKRTGEDGKALATAAIVVGIAQLVLAIIVLVAYVAFILWIFKEASTPH